MKKIAVLLVCMGVLTGFASCAKGNKESPGSDSPGASSDSAADDTSKTTASNEPKNYRLDEFDDSLISYLCMNGYDSSDFLISPASFRAALCLSAVGAQGNTRTEILNAAGFSGMDDLNKWYTSLDDSAANSVWCNEDFLGQFTDSYVSKVTEHYNADAGSCKADKLARTINDWISRKTDGATPVTDDISGASSVMISTLNLQTAWENAFSEAAVGNDGNKSMDFMEQTGEYLYSEENGVQVLAIPMENDMSFVCFLGNRTGRFEKMTGIKPEKVHVVLPKFELGSVFDFSDLSGFLLQRGINDSIDSQTANFYNMCSDGDWFMQEIIQTVRISQNENGIGVPPGTASPASPTQAGEGDEVKEFIADEPFSFAVFSGFGTKNQHMLLYGQMMNVK